MLPWPREKGPRGSRPRERCFSRPNCKVAVGSGGCQGRVALTTGEGGRGYLGRERSVFAGQTRNRRWGLGTPGGGWRGPREKGPRVFLPREKCFCRPNFKVAADPRPPRRGWPGPREKGSRVFRPREKRFRRPKCKLGNRTGADWEVVGEVDHVPQTSSGRVSESLPPSPGRRGRDPL